jgi:hypothetical protein
MDIEDHLPGAVEPVEWFVVFRERSTVRWLSWLACGHFKHVSAFSYYPGFKVWVVYDVCVTGTSIIMLSHERAKVAIAEYTEGCTVVKIPRNARPFGFSFSSRLFFYCVPAIKNIIGLRCVALRPDSLYRHILRNGGVIVYGQPDNSNRPKSGDPAGDGAERFGQVATGQNAR